MILSDESKLPTGWLITNIEQIAESVWRGKQPKYIDWSELPVINQKCIRWEGLDSNYLKFIHPEQWDKWQNEHFLRIGDILWNSTGTGTIGMAAIYIGLSGYERSVVDSHVTVIRPLIYNSKLLHYWIMSPGVQTKIDRMQSGSTNQVELSRKEILNTKVPCPPLNEQKRIIAKIEELMERIYKARNVLKDARYLEEKLTTYYTTNWEEGEFGEHIEERNELAGENWRRYPAVGLSNKGQITERREPLGEKNIHRCKVVRQGDIVFNPIRFSIGSIARYYREEPAIVSPEYQVFRTKHTMSAELICRYLRSSPGRRKLEIETQGSVRYRVYLNTLKRLVIPIAPLEQQIEAEKLFLHLNKVFAIIEETNQDFFKLEQSILDKAFRGELVDQDPNDEPASILLERIRVERDKTKFHWEKIRVKRKVSTKRKQHQLNRRSLIEVLSETNNHLLSSKQLFESAGFDESAIEEFYSELRAAIQANQIEQVRPNKNDVYLCLKQP